MAMFINDVGKFYQPESLRFNYHSLIGDDDRVHSHFTLNAITVNGKDYENHYQTLYRLKDGLICEVWEYFDTAFLFDLIKS